MRRLRFPFLVAAVALALGGCAKQSSTPAQQAPPPAEKFTPPPAGTPLAKVRSGMTQSEVETAVGRPNDQKSYVTGKAFIPFYYGPDRSRVAWYYKGQGRVIFEESGGFSSHPTVIRVEYDPNEPGRAQ
jgi:hypothetical protein